MMLLFRLGKVDYEVFFPLLPFLTRKSSKGNFQPLFSILEKVKTYFLHFICKEEHVGNEYPWKCPKFCQDRRQGWEIPRKTLEKGGHFFSSFLSYLFLSLLLFLLVFPHHFFPCQPFPFILSHFLLLPFYFSSQQLRKQ